MGQRRPTKKHKPTIREDLKTQKGSHMKKRFYPMNLQLFADEGGSGEGAGNTGTPTVEELMSQLAAAQAETARQKAAIDKLTKANGELTKNYRNSLDEAGRAKLDAETAQEEQAQTLASLQKELSTLKAKEKYMGLGMDGKMASETAQAEVDGDMAKVTANYEKFLKVVRESAVREALNGRPGVNGGNGAQSSDASVEFAKKLANQQPRRTLDEDALKRWS